MLQFNSLMTAENRRAAIRYFFHRPPWPFIIWLIIFYVSWLTFVSNLSLWDEVRSHWPISVAMAAGSYFAGSTPMGGGTVGFPVLVLLFDMPASLGRNFGLAVQSIGMTSASIYILAARRAIDWGLLKPALLGSLVATPLGAAFIAPYAPDLGVKLLFATIWASFGIIHFAKIKAIVAPDAQRAPDARLDTPVGLFVGFVGGVVAALTGVGIDMMIYAALVLFYRSDIKSAIPTSVILMAFTSIVGIASNVALSRADPALYAVDPEVFYNWLAAAPVVALGAPFGAIIVQQLPRKPTLLIVSALCIGQFVWTLFAEQVTGWPLAGALAAVLILNLFFLYLFRTGERRKSAAPEALAEEKT